MDPMDPITGTILAAVASPIVAAIVGLIVARSGTTAELRRVEYFLKRTELIEKLLSLQSNQIKEDKFPVAPLIDELNDIAASIQQSSIRQQEQDHSDFDKRPLWKRIYKLPVPRTVGGWIGSGIFYVYSLGALAYVVMLLIALVGVQTTLPTEVLLPGIFGSVLFAWLGRIWAVKSARVAASLDRARRENANKSAQVIDESVAS